MIKQTVLVFSTLNYKDTLWSVPFETVWDGDGFDAYTFLFSKFICFTNPIRECAGPNSATSNRKAATKLFFFKLIFHCRQKLHLETGLAF
jgi:iron complex outermembrane receptor protein